MRPNKIIFLIFVFALLFSFGCASNEENVQKEYEKCTSVCASVLEDDFVTMKLCMDECKEKFLGDKSS
jgi:hypothetical protein